jgi:hypothetical protein
MFVNSDCNSFRSLSTTSIWDSDYEKLRSTIVVQVTNYSGLIIIQ